MGGAVFYFAEEHETIVLSLLDPDVAKTEMLYLLFFAVLMGLIMGFLTVRYERFAIVLGTSFIGSLLVASGVAIISARPLSKLFLVMSLVGFGLFIYIQYRYTNPARSGKTVCDEVDEDEDSEASSTSGQGQKMRHGEGQNYRHRRLTMLAELVP